MKKDPLTLNRKKFRLTIKVERKIYHDNMNQKEAGWNS